jgi:hypothetical protein
MLLPIWQNGGSFKMVFAVIIAASDCSDELTSAFSLASGIGDKESKINTLATIGLEEKTPTAMRQNEISEKYRICWHIA